VHAVLRNVTALKFKVQYLIRRALSNQLKLDRAKLTA